MLNIINVSKIVKIATPGQCSRSLSGRNGLGIPTKCFTASIYIHPWTAVGIEMELLHIQPLEQ